MGRAKLMKIEAGTTVQTAHGEVTFNVPCYTRVDVVVKNSVTERERQELERFKERFFYEKALQREEVITV